MKTGSVVEKPIVSFQIGRVYDRWSEINGLFGGSRQSGIAASRVADAIFLFTGSVGEQFGYEDTQVVDENGAVIFYYTGEGQVGDMTMSKGNRAILEHGVDGRALHLFRTLGKGKGQEYLGEFVYADHKFQGGVDREGLPRKVIVFELIAVQHAEFLESTASSIVPMHAPKSLAEARQLAILAATEPGSLGGQTGIRALYVRSRAVKDYVLMRAGGVCESCAKPAPFVRPNGTPYLEPHHTTRVSDGGADHPRFVGAICPSCHSEIHYGQNGATKNRLLKQIIEEIEA